MENTGRLLGLKGERVAQSLRETTGNAQAHLLLFDLDSLASIRRASEQFHARWLQLHVFVKACC